MTPDPMTPIALPTPALTSPFTAGDTSSGGVGRVVNTQVDSKNAILLIISDANINALLQAPLTATELLDNTGIALTYADMPSILTDTAGTAVNARAGGTTRSGTVYENPEIGSTNNFDSNNIYIDSHAPVVLGYDTQDNLEFTMIGEPLSRMPTTTDAFSGIYSGFAAIARNTLSAVHLHAHSTFQMQVTVANAMPTVSSFSASFAHTDGTSEGSVSASNISIDNNLGTFSGTATFTAGQRGTAGGGGVAVSIIPTGGTGTLLGQFHGVDAAGVTGAFHNSANTVLGGFAGSKEPPPQ